MLGLASSTRFAGSVAEERARSLCESRLIELGFDVTREKFTYSQFPARFGPFICGLIFATGVLLAGHIAARHDAPLAGIILAFATLIISGVLGGVLLDQTGTLSWLPADSSNLVAIRRDASPTPTVWLVAHTDSKSQTIGMLTRVASVTITGIILVLLNISMTGQLLGMPESMGFPANWLVVQTTILSMLTAVAVVPVMLCFITDDSRGALDNATGVAAVLLSLEHIRPECNVGVLLTSAEEIGLAGARAFVGTRPEKGIAINCDTIDNSGRFICMTGDVRRPDAIAVARAGSRAAADRAGRRIQGDADCAGLPGQ